MAVKKTPATAGGKRDTAGPGGKSAGFFCYIGPNLKGRGGIGTGTLLFGTREQAEAQAAEAIAAHPLIKPLIVPGEMLGTARLEVKRPGTALYALCQRIINGE